MIYSLRSLISLFLFSVLCLSIGATPVIPGPYYGPVPLFSQCNGVRRVVVNPNTGDVYGTCFGDNTVRMWPAGDVNKPITLTNSSTLCVNPQSAVLSAQGDLYVECWNGGGSSDFVLKFPQAQPASVVAPVPIPVCGGGLAVSSSNTLYATCSGNLVSVANGGSGNPTRLPGSCGTGNLATSPVNGDVAAACSGGSVVVWVGGSGNAKQLLAPSSGSNFVVAYDNLGNLFSTAPGNSIVLFAYNALNNTYTNPVRLSGSTQAASLWFANGVGLYAANTDGSISLWPLSASNSGTVDASTLPVSVAGSGACTNPQGLQTMPLSNKVYCAAINANAVVAFVPINKCV